jgi:hypothetical protein
VIVALYIGLGTTAILVLRIMSRRFRDRQAGADVGGPYGPRPVPGDGEAERETVTV